MFVKSIEKTIEVLKDYVVIFMGRRVLIDKKQVDVCIGGCKRAFVALSGGVDSAVVCAILCEALGEENVVAMYRDIRSNSKHLVDVMELQKVLGFKLLKIDANPLYDMFLEQCKDEFERVGLAWADENTQQAEILNFGGAYASLKSRFTTPMAGFIAKAVDECGGRIFGTGNLEEDVLLRYFDKFGDGAVDNNILVGLTKMEVRQIALWFGQKYDAEIFEKIAHKTPSADLQANGDAHNDENELTTWARQMGYNITLSYGDCEHEGNIAWVIKEDLDRGIVTGECRNYSSKYLQQKFNYSDEELELIEFMCKIEHDTRHKALGIPGIERKTLRGFGLVD